MARESLFDNVDTNEILSADLPKVIDDFKYSFGTNVFSMIGSLIAGTFFNDQN